MKVNVYVIIQTGLNNGSSIMKTSIFKNYVNKKFNIIITQNIIDDKNSIYIVIKKYNKDLLKRITNLKKFNNYFIYEPLDILWTCESMSIYKKKLTPIFNAFDEIIFSNESMRYFFRNEVENSYVIYHEYDNRYNPTLKKNNIVQYIGSFDKCSFSNEDFEKYNIVNSSCSKYLNKFKDKVLTSIHIDFLKNTKSYYYLHTSTKLSTALCYNSIFICNKIPVYKELLGNKYEFYIEDDLSNLQSVVDRSKKIFSNEKLYNDYVRKIAKVKKKLSPEYVGLRYTKIIKRYIKKIKSIN